MTSYQNIRFALLVLLFAIIGRASFMEYMDLIDPTESRYASVAQEMILTNNWLTPQLPMPEGVVPYLGKPPLHFWLTALSYKFFGVDEWTARVPSLVASLLILGSIYLFSLYSFGRRIALISMLISFSSGMFFFLSGASVTDVTLTAFISLAIVSAYRFISSKTDSSSWIYLSSVSAALGFLCKGPVSSVLIAFPFVLWSLARRDLTWISKIPWIRCINIFLVIVLPWFVASEIAHPGFLKYFFWNENVGRYLVEDYGDKYGSGHVHSYGMSWLMFACAFFPWTLMLLVSLFWLGVKGEIKNILSDPKALFVVSWALSAPLFLSFIRQLHAMYLLPAIPGVSIASAILLSRLHQANPSWLDWIRSRGFNIGAYLFWAIILSVGLVLHFKVESLFLGMFYLLTGICILTYSRRLRDLLGCVGGLSTMVFVSYMIVLASFTPYVNYRRSAENILKALASHYKDDTDPIRVGVFSRNSFSLYWTTKAGDAEIVRDIEIEYVDESKVGVSRVSHMIVKASTEREISSEVKKYFSLVRNMGEWYLYQRKILADSNRTASSELVISDLVG